VNATPRDFSLRPKRFSVDELNELWRLRGLGRDPRSIGRVLGRPSRSVYAVIVRAGGIKPVPRKRAERHLSLEEREEISRRLAARESIRSIARVLGRPASTVSREVNRNDGRFRYRAVHADRRAWHKAQRPKPRKLAGNKSLRAHVVERLGLYWSPQQIASWLRETFADDPAMHVSHESIYRSLFVQARGSLKKELKAYLRRRRSIRRPAATSKRRPRGGAIQDGISIRERPPEVEDRAVPGHWEGDLLCGQKGTQVATLVERMTRFVILVKLRQRRCRACCGQTPGLVGSRDGIPDGATADLAGDTGTVARDLGLDVGDMSDASAEDIRDSGPVDMEPDVGIALDLGIHQDGGPDVGLVDAGRDAGTIDGGVVGPPTFGTPCGRDTDCTGVNEKCIELVIQNTIPGLGLLCLTDGPAFGNACPSGTKHSILDIHCLPTCKVDADCRGTNWYCATTAGICFPRVSCRYDMGSRSCDFIPTSTVTAMIDCFCNASSDLCEPTN